jgi:hypothetical protein
MRQRPGGSRRHLSSSPFHPPVQPPVESYAENDRVSHDRYGLGRVIDVEGEVAVIVAFGSQKVRIHTPFNKLTKL